MKCSGVTFGVIVSIWEIAILLIYGLTVGYNQTQNKISTYGMFASGQILVVIGLILLIVGFGLMASYISNSSISGIGFTLLIFALTFQHFFIIRAFWYKTGAFDPAQSKTLNQSPYFSAITLTNYNFDIGTFTTNTKVASAIDAIACSISILIAFLTLVGRIGLAEIFNLTLFGTFFWQVNNALLYRFYITDVGYGMRIFIYGSFLALISSFVLGKQSTTINHPRYNSQYPIQALSLLGVMIVWCCFPILTIANLFTSSKGLKILSVAPLNMWLGLSAGVVGSFACSALSYRKIHIYDIIFSSLTGGIAFSSSGNINFNPSVPLTVGYVVGFVSSFLNQSFNRRINKGGVVFSLTLIQHFLIPGLVSGFLSAILQGIGQNTYNDSGNYMDNGRTFVSQGAWQLMGIVFSAGVGILAGIIIGTLFKCTERHDKEHQFNDLSHYDTDQKPNINKTQ